MTTRHLLIFQKVCETGSITRAAEQLFMTQPAVSHAIRELETELDLVLFDRISRKIFLTEAGKLFLRKVNRILDLYEDLSSGISHLKKQALLRIGSSITIANLWLPAIVQAFQAHPHATPHRATIDRASVIQDLLLKNELDLALIEGAISDEQLTCIPFSSYPLLVVCAPAHPFAQKKALSLKELAMEPLLLREPGSAIRNTLDSIFLLHGLSAEPLWTSSNSQVLIQGVKQNLGLTVLPDVLIRRELSEGSLTALTLTDATLRNENHIVYHRDKYLTDAIKAFLTAAQQVEPIPL